MTKFKPDLPLRPAVTRAACQSALDELQDADKKAAKELLKGRLKEAKRLRALLAKADKGLELAHARIIERSKREDHS